MSLPAPRHHYSFAQYLEVEEISKVRHEYYEGEIYAMAGGTPEHAAAIAAAANGGPGATVGSQAVPRVQLGFAGSDLGNGSRRTPDVTVGCGASERRSSTAQPTWSSLRSWSKLLSPSTEAYDWTRKLQHYQQDAVAETPSSWSKISSGTK